jgi:hypothetical protein
MNRYGMIINSGNITISSSHFDSNGYGFQITNAYNNAHGSISSSTVNHNKVYGFYIDSVSNGFLINGCSNWFSNFYCRASSGIIINGCNFGAITINLISGGTNYLKNNWFSAAPTMVRSSDFFIISDNPYGNAGGYTETQYDLITNSYFAYNLSSRLISHNGNYQLTGKLGINYDPAYAQGPNGLHCYTANAFTGISTGNSVPVSSNVAIMTSTAVGKDIGGVLGLGGNYKAVAQTYSGAMFGGFKGAKENATDNNFNGYLGFYTNTSGTFSEKARITSAGYWSMDSTESIQGRDVLIPSATKSYTPTVAGSGVITVDSAGVTKLIAFVHWDSDCTTYIDFIQYIAVSSSYITYSTANTAGNYLSFVDNGASFYIKNNRGYTLNYSLK